MWQGDPLSPLLFVLVMEAVGRMLDKAIHEGCLLGFRVGDSAGRTLVVSHLFFTDDTLIFCDANIVQMLILCMVLIWFEAVSSLKVNLGKSELVAMGAIQNIELLVAVLNCKQGSLPMKYLGLPLGAKFKDKTILESNSREDGKKISRLLGQMVGGAKGNVFHICCLQIILFCFVMQR